MAIRVYVGNLPYSASDEQLAELFRVYGEVSEASVVRDRTSGQSKGFGFVQMADDEVSRRAMLSLDGTMMDGRTIHVNEADERHERDGAPHGGETGERSGRPPRRDFGDRPPRREYDDRGPRRDYESRGPRRDYDDRPPRREYDDRPPRREFRDFDDRPPRRSYDDRPPRREYRDFGDRPPRREYDDRPPRRSFDDRPPRRDYYDDRPPRRDYEDRGPRRTYDDRPPRREYDDRPPRRDYEDRGPRRSDRSDRGDFGRDRGPRRDFEGRPPRREFGGDRRPPRRDFGGDRGGPRRETPAWQRDDTEHTHWERRHTYERGPKRDRDVRDDGAPRRKTTRPTGSRATNRPKRDEFVAEQEQES